jgi:Asp-tRNA(Asn)/Glu-tRNA(Gln) amidotransferase A subunit family amidase
LDAVDARIRDGELARAEAARLTLRRELYALLDGVDFVASPTTPEVASRYHADGLRDGEIDDRQFAARVAFTYVANLAGLPAIQVPCGTAYGLPVGLQLIGAPGAEARLLEVAAAAERLWANGGAASRGAPGDRGHRR